MANTNIYESMLQHFSLALTVFEIFTFQLRDLENVGQDRDVHCRTFAEGPFDGKCLTSYRMAVVMLAFFTVFLSKYPLEKFGLENLGQDYE